MVTKLVLRHALKAGATLHLAGGATLLQLAAFGLLLVAAIMAVRSLITDGLLGQAKAQRAAMGGALWRWFEVFAAGFVYQKNGNRFKFCQQSWDSPHDAPIMSCNDL